jgi:hypothetical protein
MSRAANRTPYKPPRQTAEIVKAVIAAASVVVVTVIAIWLLKPDDSSDTPAPSPVISTPAGSIDTTATTAPGTPDPTATTPSTLTPAPTGQP